MTKKIYLSLLMVTAISLTSCNQSKIDSLNKRIDSLKMVNTSLQKELNGYKNSPSKLLAEIKDLYKQGNAEGIKNKLDILKKYHPESSECTDANNVYAQIIKDQEIARQKEEARIAKEEAERRAKMKPIERVMEKYDCTEDVARSILKHQVMMGMTHEQARAAWGRPRDVNRSVGSYGVHEQWCYDGCYLYFEDGVLTSWQN